MELVGYTVDDMVFCLNTMEETLAMDQEATLNLHTQTLPTEEALDSFYLDLAEAGFHTSYPEICIIEGIPTTTIVLRKGSPVWAALIPLIPTALLFGLIAFGITKIGDISKALLPLLLTGVGGIIIVAAVITRKPVVEAVGKYAERRL